jgi:hypothetical protein
MLGLEQEMHLSVAAGCVSVRGLLEGVQLRVHTGSTGPACSASAGCGIGLAQLLPIWGELWGHCGQ